MELVEPVCSVMYGIPVTVTDSLKFTVSNNVSPAIKKPSAILDETVTTLGTEPFTVISLLEDNELVVPIAGIVNIVAFPAESKMVALFKDNAFVLL